MGTPNDTKENVATKTEEEEDEEGEEEDEKAAEGESVERLAVSGTEREENRDAARSANDPASAGLQH